MKYLTYNAFVEETKNISHKILFVDGPRRCSTNYTRKSILYMIDNKYIGINLADESHDNSIYKKDGKYLHNKNIIHIVPVRDPRLSIVSSLLMRSYDDLEMPFNQQYLINEFSNFTTFLNLEKNYENVISVPIELFDNNEEKILDLILKKYDISAKTYSLDKNLLIKSFNSFKEAGKNGLIKYHSYPIEEQKSNEYITKRLFFENFVNDHAKDLLGAVSQNYQEFLKEKRLDWKM